LYGIDGLHPAMPRALSIQLTLIPCSIESRQDAFFKKRFDMQSSAAVRFSHHASVAGLRVYAVFFPERTVRLSVRSIYLVQSQVVTVSD